MQNEYIGQVLTSSIVAGTLVGCVTTPFDVVKNFWQFNSSLAKNRTSVNTFNIITHLYQRNGLRTFWTGLGPALGVIIPSNIIFFSLFERMSKDDRPFWASVKARFVAVTIISPMEYLRTNLQANIGSTDARTLIHKAMQEEGLISFWRGVIPSLIRDAPFSAIYWELNALGLEMLESYDHNYRKRSNMLSNFVYPFTVAGISGGIASVLTHPFDVIKTNMQAAEHIHKARGFVFVKKESSAQIVQRIFKKEGVAGFFVGIFPRTAKLIPSSAILLGTYEFTKSFVNHSSDK